MRVTTLQIESLACTCDQNASLTQLVEYRFCKPAVGGSSPLGGSYYVFKQSKNTQPCKKGQEEHIGIRFVRVFGEFVRRAPLVQALALTKQSFVKARLDLQGAYKTELCTAPLKD